MVPAIEIFEFSQKSVRNDDAARRKDASLIVRILDVPLNGYQSFAKLLQLFEHFRGLVRIARILPTALDRLGCRHAGREILETLLEDTYFLKRE